MRVIFPGIMVDKDSCSQVDLMIPLHVCMTLVLEIRVVSSKKTMKPCRGTKTP